MVEITLDEALEQALDDMLQEQQSLQEMVEDLICKEQVRLRRNMIKAKRKWSNVR